MHQRRFVTMMALVVVAAGVAVDVIGGSQARAAVPLTSVDFSDRQYTPLTPSRILDTRSGIGQPGAAPVGAGSTIDLSVLGHGGVPATGVGAVVLNVTGTQPSASTYVTVFPTGQPRPTASNLNLIAGQTAPNLMIAKIGSGGSVSLYNNSGSVQLIADVMGWFSDGAGFTGLVPARVLDTRSGVGRPAAGRVGPGATIDLAVSGRGGVPLDGVGAVVLNVTATQPSASTYVTVYPAGEARPTASNLNVAAGQTRPNLVIAKVGSNGEVSLFNHAGSVHLVADVMGWMPVAVDYASVTPARILDTRSGLGQPSAGRVGAGAVIRLPVTGVGGVPTDQVAAVVVNLTGTQATASTYVTAYPSDGTRPTASNLNLGVGQTAPNLVIVKVGADGAICSTTTPDRST